MGRGGKRKGAGRPRGSKEKEPRTRKAILPVADKKNIEKYADSGKPLYLQISKYLSAANKKLYKQLYVKYESPLECLKTLRDDLMFRYNYARVAEMEGTEYAKLIAIENIEKLKKDGKEKEAKELEAKIKKAKFPKLSMSVTSLASEIRMLNEVIDKIQSGKPSKTMNIFNIMLREKDAKKIEGNLFKFPEDIVDAEVVKEKKKNGDNK